MSEQPHVTVIGPDGQPVDPATAAQLMNGSGADNEAPESPLARMVSSPDKVMRIGNMIKQLLEEVRAAPLDDASRLRLKEIQARSIRELSDGLAPELQDELARITLPFSEDSIPSDAELRIAQAQLVGWLEGVFHGIQTTLFAQQMAAQAQLQQMRGRALPAGVGGPNDGSLGSGTGQYL
jgi:Protein of unknown function (DUF2587)